MPQAQQVPVENLPDDVILFLLPSRYCEIDRMMDLAWSLFKDTPTGWARVKAICDYLGIEWRELTLPPEAKS